MPGFDGTGPRGEGASTGGGRGYCVGYPARIPRRRFVPVGTQEDIYSRGFGRGFGRGQGLGRGFRRFGAVQPYAYGSPYGNAYGSPAISAEDEARVLKEESRAMQDEIAAINQRIKELESNAASEGNE